jgi:hypothetical protein
MEHGGNEGQRLIARLRAADDLDVFAALAGAPVAVPLASADELVEFFNRMLDVLLEEPAD